MPSDAARPRVISDLNDQAFLGKAIVLFTFSPELNTMQTHVLDKTLTASWLYYVTRIRRNHFQSTSRMAMFSMPKVSVIWHKSRHSRCISYLTRYWGGFSTTFLSVSSALNDHFLSFPSSFQLVNIEGDLIKNNHLGTSKKTDSMVYRINTEKEGFMLDNDPRTRRVRGHYRHKSLLLGVYPVHICQGQLLA